MNRLLLHGARYHDRDAVFHSKEGTIPDWRADRNAVRAGLALAEEFSIGPGDVVAIWMPLSVEWAFLERGIWGLGATSLPLWPEWSRDEVLRILERERPKLLVAADSVTPSDLLERGGVLDTPERASRFRAMARAIPAEALASLEPSPQRALSHAEWVERVRAFAERNPPRRGMRHVVEGERPALEARIVLHSGWADGVTTVVLGLPKGGGSESRRFVNLGDANGGISWDK
jgi:acyl-CoA synthetase (AMP-forming)/AMP-acid ligase II